MKRLAWAAWLLFVWSCGARLPPVPSQGGPAWLELDSPHFKMWTDASAARGRELLQQMEHFRSIIYGVAFPDVPPGGVTVVIALRDRGESESYTPPTHPAVTTRPENSSIHQPTILMAADEESDRNQDTPHELTHAVSYNAVHNQPHWFAEGLATYFQTIALDTKTETVTVGRPPAVVGLLRTHDPLRFEEMLHCKDAKCTEDPMFYATAWLVFAYLRGEHPKELLALERLIPTLPPDESWKQAFPGLAPEQITGEVRGWMFNGNLKLWNFTIALQQWPVTVRPMTDAEVRSVRALALMFAHRDFADTEAIAALALDSNNLVAQGVEAQLAVESKLGRRPKLGHLPSPAVARALTVAHPDQWLAWALLWVAIHTGPEADAAKVKMCALAAPNPALDLGKVCKPSAPQPSP